MAHGPSKTGERLEPKAAPATNAGPERPPSATSSPDGAATTNAASPPGPAAPQSAVSHERISRRRIVVIAVVIVVLALAAYFGVPIVDRALNTVSTDDAYVNGHFTLVAARVPGYVLEVLVDDNYRVRKGDVLVRLDPQPYQVIVDAKPRPTTWPNRT